MKNGHHIPAIVAVICAILLAALMFGVGFVIGKKHTETHFIATDDTRYPTKAELHKHHTEMLRVSVDSVYTSWLADDLKGVDFWWRDALKERDNIVRNYNWTPADAEALLMQVLDEVNAARATDAAQADSLLPLMKRMKEVIELKQTTEAPTP